MRTTGTSNAARRAFTVSRSIERRVWRTRCGPCALSLAERASQQSALLTSLLSRIAALGPPGTPLGPRPWLLPDVGNLPSASIWHSPQPPRTLVLIIRAADARLGRFVCCERAPWSVVERSPRRRLELV